jgi:hypothetical protein
MTDPVTDAEEVLGAKLRERVCVQRYRTPQLELAGVRSGKLVAVEKAGVNHEKRILWRCQCDCGNETLATASAIKLGLNRSCGCAKSSGKGARQDGRSKRPEYMVWQIMRQRCGNPADDGYYLYGARGIRVCAEWDTKDGFAAFIAHLGPRPSADHSIDRIDNDRGYEPGNVRWATPKQQAANRRTTHYLTIDGETYHVSEWARRAGVKIGTIFSRLRQGFTGHDLLFKGNLRWRS